MRQDDPGPIKDKKIRDDLKAKFGATLDEGIEYMNRGGRIGCRFVVVGCHPAL